MKKLLRRLQRWWMCRNDGKEFVGWIVPTERTWAIFDQADNPDGDEVVRVVYAWEISIDTFEGVQHPEVEGMIHIEHPRLKMQRGRLVPDEAGPWNPYLSPVSIAKDEGLLFRNYRYEGQVDIET